MIGRRTKAAQAAREARIRALRQAMRVRHRAPGHLRFDLPEALCTPEAAAVLTAGLEAIDGVYRVTVFAGAGKLSIRWFPEVRTPTDIARALAELVEEAAEVVPPPLAEGGAVGFLGRLKQAAPVRAVRDRWEDLRAKAEMVGKIVAIKTGKPVPTGGEMQEWVIHFLNDLVAFYLIRRHWDRIIGQWLPRPWAFRYEWLSVVYLTFLLVRYRKGAVPKVKK